ncbi:hypothetical protein HBH69_062170 [Parastagonospora nodorum]|nr:hypothetical protein HBI06_038960 [Parastagonospora nodorum]KAH4239061.1 hypothetical protein HBI05_121940 [Parastagonospora nodorum]KAH5158492.1 hypothetical protein HBH69_062170 [Parastagonospora nodorum]KAH5514029.1 hypothetical protein HBI52_118310 [Parastagonospora nodorum]
MAPPIRGRNPPPRPQQEPCVDWRDNNPITADRSDISSKTQLATGSLYQAIKDKKTAIAASRAVAKEWQTDQKRVRDFPRKTKTTITPEGDEETTDDKRTRVASLMDRTKKLKEQLKQEREERPLLKERKMHNAHSPLQGHDAKRQRIDGATSSDFTLSSENNPSDPSSHTSLDSEEGLNPRPFLIGTHEKISEQVFKTIDTRPRPSPEETCQDPLGGLQDLVRKGSGVANPFVRATPRSEREWPSSQTLPVAIGSNQTWLESPLPDLENKSGYANSPNTPSGTLVRQRAAERFEDSARSQRPPFTPFSRHLIEANDNRSQTRHTMLPRNDDSVFATPSHRSTSTGLTVQGLHNRMNALGRATSAQPSSQTLPSRGSESSLPGTPAMSFSMRAMQKSLSGGTPTPSDATVAAETPAPRRTQRSATPAATPRPSGKTSVLDGMLSVQKRRIAQVTVPVQTAAGATTWRRPAELPASLVEELERSLYSAMDEREKARVWGKYSQSETNCILTTVIGRGATSSEFKSPFRACTMCIKRNRICAKLVDLGNGSSALGFHPLPSAERKTNVWTDIRFYVDSKS